MSGEATYEEALNLTGFGVYNVKLFAICFFILMAVVAEIFGQSLSVASSTCDLNLTTATKGTVIAMPMLGIVLSAHLWGWLADTRGRRKVMMFSLTGSWAMSIISSLSTVWPMMAILGFMSGFFISASNSICYAMISECTPQKHRNMLCLMLANGLFFGQIFNAGITYFILSLTFSFPIPVLNIKYSPWRLLEVTYGLTAGIGALMLFFFVKESPKFYISRGMPDEGIKILRQIYHQNTKNKIEQYPVTVINFEEKVVTNDEKVGVLKSWWQQTTPMFRHPLLKNTLILVYMVIIFYTVSPSLTMWMPTITDSFSEALKANENYCNFCQLLRKGMKINNVTALRRVADVEIQRTPCVNTLGDMVYIIQPVLATVIMILNCFCVFMLRYISKKTMAIVLMLTTGICGLLSQCIPHSIICIILFFTFMTNVLGMGLTSNFAVEIYPTYLKAMSMCFTIMAGRGVSFVFINVAGILILKYCEITFYALSFFVLSGALVSLFLPKEKQ